MSFTAFEVTVQATYALDASVNGVHELGFTPLGYRVALQSGGPVQYSFDGVTDAGALGPSGTRPMEIEIHGGAKSRVWFKGASSEVINFQAWDTRAF